MDEYESLSHSAWDCKYHVVFIPKYRRKALYVQLRRHLGDVFRRLQEIVLEQRPVITGPDGAKTLLSSTS